MNVLTIQGLSKAFGGQKIIDNLNMTVPEGSVFGFIGQNGAGKTTTMKMVLGLLRPNQGEIIVCNEPVHFGQTKTNQYIGYLPDVPEFYDYMTPIRYLALCGEIIGLSKAETYQRGEELLSLVGLGNVKKTIGGFSRGMKQRLGIAQALLNRPRLLILDEPTAGLDPKERARFRNLIGEAGKEGIVILSTHIVSDIEQIADTVLMMKDGRLIFQGEWQEGQGDLEKFYLEQFEDGGLYQKMNESGKESGGNL